MVRIDFKTYILEYKNLLMLLNSLQGIFYDTLRKCTFHQFDTTVDIEWKKKSETGIYIIYMINFIFNFLMD